MGAEITYMGTKRALAPIVSQVISTAQPGKMLDVFSGMCSVGEAVGVSRQVWSNDVQVFASEVARALFASKDDALSAVACGDVHFANFRRQKERLSKPFAKSLAREAQLISAASYPTFKDALSKLQATLKREVANCRLRSPHLFTTTYAATYFGVLQCVEADSIAASIRAARQDRETSEDEYRWCMIALGRALLKVSNSTGHFAQYLRPKATNLRRHLALRRRSVWAEWLSSLTELSPIGTTDWRRNNRVFNKDCLKLLPSLANASTDIGVIYADPPYTDDQYSRFYHILETLCLYDYPIVTGAGLYRPNRFQTPFSLKSKASAALAELISNSAKTGADLVLSYPTNGLANKAGCDIRGILRKYFRHVEICHTLAHVHSTFGASKGPAQNSATELIYLARST